MLFHSPIFLFLYLPCLYFFYRLAPNNSRNGILLAASFLFYAWAKPVFIFWVLGSALLDWVLGQVIAGSAEARTRKAAVTLGVVANVALLAYFKYANFFWSNFAEVLNSLGVCCSPLLRVALPVAISFIVFEKITYLVDLYRRTCHPADNLLTYLLYVFYFPKLLAGPIIRYHDIDEQLALLIGPASLRDAGHVVADPGDK
jgi:alginate O-acetyltransferase complex protein AlgI